ncbi:diguanylate cyclase (GGDEF)-like protein/PAS domain S-box-containing protein [Variovorax paradoxus]|uniref:sensor domain-containing diguanylate cyclase n=1 Tax=Variovorax paradoxus TaxID=34073 RepID=UPI00278CAE74|nr:PAS domain-containing protein [Variovorax paradoxus]MDQ0572482.1 diguanylate cyclase (GGDEF)-like protein/PAS domain S-box-containing protein [Variovorax paradoxus]
MRPVLDLRRFSLRARLSAGVVAIVLLTTVGITSAALYFVKRDMQTAIADEQFERISNIADAVDQKFLSRRTLLKTFGDSVESQNFTGTEGLQDLVVQHQSSLKEAFDNLAFVDAGGEIVANMNGAQQIGKINVKDRDYFQRTIAAGAGVVSQPFKNRISGLAQVAMTEPVLDRQGRIAYVITAFITLSERNFLGELARVKFGKSGYMFIVNTGGIIIDHPDKSRLLQHIDADGIRNFATDRAVAGFEGATEGVNRRGVHALYAFKHIGQTNWVLGAMYPRSEAFAPVEQIERFAWAGALLLTLLAGGLTFMTVRAQLAPLSRLREHMQVSRTLPDYTPMQEKFSGHAGDEVGDLSRAFDSLMRERQASQDRVQSSERFLRDVTDNLPAVVAYFDRDNRCLFANKAGLGMRGRTQADIGRMTMQESLPDAVYRQLVPKIALVLQGTPSRTEGTYDRNGKEGFFECHLAPDIRADGVAGYYVMTFDITRQKVAERERAAGETRVRTITDNLPALVSHVDASLRFTFVNAHLRALFEGIELVGQSLPDVRGAEDFEAVAPYVRRVLAGEAVTFEKMGDPARGIDKNWYQSHYIPDLGSDGTVRGFYGMTFDITERKQAEMRSAESERRLRGLTDNVPALMTELDLEERVVFCNGRYQTWLGMAPASMMNRHIRETIGEAHYEMRKPLLARAFAGEVVSFEQTARLLIGERTLQTTYLPQTNAQGEVVGLYILANDVTELKQKQKQLDALAREDALTGLPNRRSFEEHARDAMARSRRSGVPVCLLFLDIDYFKSINDSLGHSAGDAVLKEFGRRLKESVRKTDMAARYAGDEFVILLEGVAGMAEVQGVAAKVLAAMRPAFHLSGRTLRATTSIGVALSEEDEDFSSLFIRADTALYAAKKEGKNRFMMAVSKSETTGGTSWPRQEPSSA